MFQPVQMISQMTTKIPLSAPGETRQTKTEQIPSMPPVGGDQTVPDLRKPPECIGYLPMAIRGHSEFILYTP